MKEILEKIDAKIARLHEEQRSMRSGVDAERVWLKIDEAEIIKRIILSEQKEPCEYCTETSKIEMYIHDTVEDCKWCDKEKCDNYDDSCYGIGYGVVPQNFCPVCGRHLNQPYTE